MEIELINEIDLNDDGIINQMKTVIEGAVKHAAGIAELNESFEVCLTLTDDEGIHTLNREHRGVDSVTDVLSFPLLEFEAEDNQDPDLDCDDLDCDDLDCDDLDCDEYPDTNEDPFEDYRNPQSGNIMLGDIVINMDRAREQAAQYGHSFEREACYLCVHSVLHLFGYDHMVETEKAQMRTLEEEIMNGFGIKR